jgi:hypothetical protein
MVLAFAAGGAALMNTWLSMVHASLPGRLVTTLPWLSLVLLAVLRLRRAQREARERLSVDHKEETVTSGIGWSAALLIAGVVVGLLVLEGNAVLLGVVAIGYTFAPWDRIRLCRQRPVRAGVLICGGGALVLAICRHDVAFMFLPIAAWILGMSSVIALLGTTRMKLPAQQPEKNGGVPVQP